MDTEVEYASSFFKRIRALENPDETSRASEGKHIYHSGVFEARRRDAPKRGARALRRKALRWYSRKMTHVDLKKDGLYDYQLGSRKYQDFLPMHDLWTQYMKRVLGEFRPGARLAMDVLGAKLLKADFHGAFVIVTESATPSLIGHSGIVLFEFKNSFMIVDKRSELLKIPKQGTTFTLKVCGLILRLHGTHLRFKASERSVQKFRVKF